MSRTSAAETFAALDQLGAELLAGAIDGPGWQTGVEQLFARADHQALRSALGVDWKAARREVRTQGQSTLVLEPDQLQGGPPDPTFRSKLWLFADRHAIVPHGHRNLVSAFFVLEGRFRGRHYDRIRDEPDAIVISPTDDRTFAPGDCAAICDRHDNVHWFTALDHDALLFNVGLTLPEHLRGRPGQREGATERVYLDPEGEPLEGGLIRAPRASLATLRAKYDG
ncbi:hypothetical protein ACNOYE_25595 [Nannocystaceae bacterium ST9]